MNAVAKASGQEFEVIQLVFNGVPITGAGESARPYNTKLVDLGVMDQSTIIFALRVKGGE